MSNKRAVSAWWAVNLSDVSVLHAFSFFAVSPPLRTSPAKFFLQRSHLLPSRSLLANIQLSKWSQRRSCRRRMTDSVCGACGPPPLQHFASECERMCLASVLGRRPRCRVVCDDWAESLHINACVRDITERAGWRKSISSRSDAYGTVRSRRHRSSPGQRRLSNVCVWCVHCLAPPRRYWSVNKSRVIEPGGENTGLLKVCVCVCLC